MFKDDLLKGKTILITGGGTGLGLAMSHQVASYGADLWIIGRRQEKLDRAKQELEAHGTTVRTASCDIRDPEGVEEMLSTIWSEGPLDALVNNAAGNFAAPSESLSHRAVDAVLGGARSGGDSGGGGAAGVRAGAEGDLAMLSEALGDTALDLLTAPGPGPAAAFGLAAGMAGEVLSDPVLDRMTRVSRSGNFGLASDSGRRPRRNL